MQFGSFDEIREVRKYIKLDILRYIDPSRRAIILKSVSFHVLSLKAA